MVAFLLVCIIFCSFLFVYVIIMTRRALNDINQSMYILVQKKILDDIRNSNIEKKIGGHSEEHKKKISLAMKNRHVLLKKRKMSESPSELEDKT